MDWLIKMEMAKANIIRALVELEEVEGLEYLVGELLATKADLSAEIEEYKQHMDLVDN
jgi:hypothetical protein